MPNRCDGAAHVRCPRRRHLRTVQIEQPSVAEIAGSDSAALARQGDFQSLLQGSCLSAPYLRRLQSSRLQFDLLIIGAGEAEPLSVAAPRYDFMRLSPRGAVRHTETRHFGGRLTPLVVLSEAQGLSRWAEMLSAAKHDTPCQARVGTGLALSWKGLSPVLQRHIII